MSLTCKSEAHSKKDSRQAPRLSWLIASLGTLLCSLAMAADNSGPAAVEAAEQASAQTGEDLQVVVVTGSMIKRTDTETPAPVQIVSSQELQESGYTSVSDVLRQLASNGQGTLSQSFSNAFAGGASGVALRGLTVGATLTLIDGNRMVPYPLSDDGQRSFVDVTAIPFNAVDHIEVLKDGASSEYGSDAIAGVVNIILKKTYQGTEITAEQGMSQDKDGNLTHIAGIIGTGDLATDGYNAYLSFEWRRQGQILNSARSGLWTNLDWTGFGGLNTTPGSANNPLVPFPATLTGYLMNPANPTLAGAAFLPGCTYALQQANQCTFTDPNLQIQPPTSSFNLLSKLTKKLGTSWETNVALSWFNSQSQQAGDGYISSLYPGGMTQIALAPGAAPRIDPNPPLVLTLPANYPGNPFGVAAPLVYNFAPNLAEFSTDTYRAMVTAGGPMAGWDVNLSAGIEYALTTNTQLGAPDPVLIQQELNAFTPLSQLESSAAFAQTIGTESSQVNLVNAKGTRDLFDLPGGPLSLGIGVEWWEKKLNATAPEGFALGTQLGNDAFAVGTQQDSAVFAELQGKVIKSLEVDLAGRVDHYNTFGTSATPSMKLKWKPWDELAFRGTWGKGFRAPNVAESGQSGEAFLAATTPDPILCPNSTNPNTKGNFPSQCSVQLVGVQTSNPSLQPEKSTNYTFGLVYEPVRGASLTVDYYDIKINQDIVSAFLLGGLCPSCLNLPGLVRGPSVIEPQCTNTVTTGTCTTAPVLTPAGLIIYQPYPYENGTATTTNGIDVNLHSVIDLEAAGKLTAELDYTRILTYILTAPGFYAELAGTHGPSGISGDTGNPKDRAVVRLSWDKGPVEIATTISYVSDFSVTDPSAGQDTCAQAMYDNFTLQYGARYNRGQAFPSSFCNVASFTETDLYGKYTVNEHLSIHGSVLNVFNRPPPLDIVTYGGGGGLAYDAAMHQAGAVGRFFTIGGTYTF
jgi:iron complex outermembrane recepter protein